jgi:hypothetical protein
MDIKEFTKSLLLFCWGFLKHWYWLVPALLSDPINFLSLFGVHMTISYPYNWIVIGVSLLLAIVLTYHDLRMAYIKTKDALEYKDKTEQSYKLTPRQTLNYGVISDLQDQMNNKHGAFDDGITQDYLDGYSTDEIMKMNCTICGEPRNKPKGDGHII